MNTDDIAKNTNNNNETVKELTIKAEKLAEDGKLEESYSIFLEIIELDPKNYNAHISLGNINYHTGEKEAAVKNYINTAKINPMDRDAVMNLTYTLIEIDNRELSQKIMDAYLAENRDKMEEILDEV